MLHFCSYNPIYMLIEQFIVIYYFIIYQIFQKNIQIVMMFFGITQIHSKYYINVKFKLIFNAKFLDRIYLHLILCYGYFYVNTISFWSLDLVE